MKLLDSISYNDYRYARDNGVTKLTEQEIIALVLKHGEYRVSGRLGNIGTFDYTFTEYDIVEDGEDEHDQEVAADAYYNAI